MVTDLCNLVHFGVKSTHFKREIYNTVFNLDFWRSIWWHQVIKSDTENRRFSVSVLKVARGFRMYCPCSMAPRSLPGENHGPSLAGCRRIWDPDLSPHTWDMLWVGSWTKNMRLLTAPSLHGSYLVMRYCDPSCSFVGWFVRSLTFDGPNISKMVADRDTVPMDH